MVQQLGYHRIRCSRSLIRSSAINGSLVTAGLAWHYVKYAPDDITLVEAETRARELKKELWSGSHKIIAPWDWRKMSQDERDLYR